MIDIATLRNMQFSEDKGCYELCQAVYKQIGKILPAFDCPEHPEKSLVHKLINEGKKLLFPLKNPEPFCLVTFRIGKYESHIGVVLEDCRNFIHKSKNTDVTISRLSDLKWKHRIEGLYRWVN